VDEGSTEDDDGCACVDVGGGCVACGWKLNVGLGGDDAGVDVSWTACV